MLFYIKHEIIGDEYASKLDSEPDSLSYESMDLQLPDVPMDLPAEWWDRTCDASLLIGVYKHGFEKYAQMRLDERLCFLTMCGPPDAQEILAEEQKEQQQENENEANDEAAAGDNEAATTTTTTAKKEEKGEAKEDGESTGYKR